MLDTQTQATGAITTTEDDTASRLAGLALPAWFRGSPSLAPLATSLVVVGALSSGCSLLAPEPLTREVSWDPKQDWELGVGTQIGEFKVVGSLGDVSVEMNDGLYVPAAYGAAHISVDRNDPTAVYLEFSNVPAYIFRIGGLKPQSIVTGESVAPGTRYARGDDLVHVRVGRRQPEGWYSSVESSKEAIEILLGGAPNSQSSPAEVVGYSFVRPNYGHLARHVLSLGVHTAKAEEQEAMVR